MSQLVGLFRFQNPDSTADLNKRYSSVAQKGVFDAGATDPSGAGGVTTQLVYPYGSQLAVQIVNFLAVGTDGMAVEHRSPPTAVVEVVANQTQYIVLKSVYNSSGSPDIQFERFSSADWSALVSSEKAKRIILAKVILGPGATQVDPQNIDLTENDIIDKGARSFIRGVVDDFADLPVDNPLTEIQRVRVGDVYLVVNDRQFYRWDGSAWDTVTDGALEARVTALEGNRVLRAGDTMTGALVMNVTAATVLDINHTVGTGPTVTLDSSAATTSVDINHSGGAGPAVTIDSSSATAAVVTVSNTGSGIGLSVSASNETAIVGTGSGASKAGVSGTNASASGIGVIGTANGSNATAVRGFTSGTNGKAGDFYSALGTAVVAEGADFAVDAYSNDASSSAVKGESAGASGIGVEGVADSLNGTGVSGSSVASGGVGVRGTATHATGIPGHFSTAAAGATALIVESNDAGGAGIGADISGTGSGAIVTGGLSGLEAIANDPGGVGLKGTGDSIGVHGRVSATNSFAVWGEADLASSNAIRGNATAASTTGVYAFASTNATATALVATTTAPAVDAAIISGNIKWLTGGRAVYSRSTDQTGITSAGADITLPNTVIAASAGVTFSSPTFNLSTAGMYRVSYNVSIEKDATSNLITARILLDGSPYGAMTTTMQTSTAEIFTLSSSSIISATAGQTVKLNVIPTGTDVTAKLASVTVERISSNS